MKEALRLLVSTEYTAPKGALGYAEMSSRVSFSSDVVAPLGAVDKPH